VAVAARAGGDTAGERCNHEQIGFDVVVLNDEKVRTKPSADSVLKSLFENIGLPFIIEGKDIARALVFL
jgi:hypothetical protein